MWGAVIQGALAAYQLSQAEKQKQKGQDMMDSNNRPKLVTPDEMKQNLAIAMQAKDRAAIMGMPGDNVTAERIQQGTQNNFNNMINTGQSPESIIAGLSSLDNNEKNAFVDLGTKGAEYKLNNERAADATLMNANTALANEKLNEFDYNQNQPYQANAAAGSALVGAGNQNENTALTNLGNAAAYGIASAENNNGGNNRMPNSAPVITPMAEPTATATIPPSQPYVAQPIQPASPAAPQQAPNALRVDNSGQSPNNVALTAIMKRYPNASMQQLKAIFPHLFQ